MNFKELTNTLFSLNGINLSNEQIDKFEKYYNLLVEWNKKFNLTAIIEPKEVIIKHFVDSIVGEKLIGFNSSICDIGTGAGFPGIPLKIVRNDVSLLLVDSLNKRTVFLNEVVKQLNLENVEVIHARAEILASNESYREKYDYCVSRAVAKLSTLLEYCSPFVKVGGKVLAYKSVTVNEEIKTSSNALKVLKLKHNKNVEFTVLGMENNITRNIVEISKINKTPKQFPRGGNKPKTTPL